MAPQGCGIGLHGVTSCWQRLALLSLLVLVALPVHTVAFDTSWSQAEKFAHFWADWFPGHDLTGQNVTSFDVYGPGYIQALYIPGFPFIGVGCALLVLGMVLAGGMCCCGRAHKKSGCAPFWMTSPDPLVKRRIMLAFCAIGLFICSVIGLVSNSVLHTHIERDGMKPIQSTFLQFNDRVTTVRESASGLGFNESLYRITSWHNWLNASTANITRTGERVGSYESLRDGLMSFLYVLTIIFALFCCWVVWKYYKGGVRTMFIAAVTIMTFFWCILGAFFLPATVFAGQLCLKFEPNVDVVLRVDVYNATKSFHYYTQCEPVETFPYERLEVDVGRKLDELEKETHPTNATRVEIAQLTKLLHNIIGIRCDQLPSDASLYHLYREQHLNLCNYAMNDISIATIAVMVLLAFGFTVMVVGLLNLPTEKGKYKRLLSTERLPLVGAQLHRLTLRVYRPNDDDSERSIVPWNAASLDHEW